MDFEDDSLLDQRLTAAIEPPALSSEFRAALRSRLPRRRFAWPDFLPDLAHLCGCAAALAIVLWIVPGHSGLIAGGGSGFALVTYFLQAVLRSSLEPIE